jgi:hypothetical protein
MKMRRKKREKRKKKTRGGGRRRRWMNEPLLAGLKNRKNGW